MCIRRTASARRAAKPLTVAGARFSTLTRLAPLPDGANILLLWPKGKSCGEQERNKAEQEPIVSIARRPLSGTLEVVRRCAASGGGESDEGRPMRAVIALIVIVYLVGVGVALAPTIESNWKTETAAQFADSVGRELPFALVWPARVYHDVTDRG